MGCNPKSNLQCIRSVIPNRVPRTQGCHKLSKDAANQKELGNTALDIIEFFVLVTKKCLGKRAFQSRVPKFRLRQWLVDAVT